MRTWHEGKGGPGAEGCDSHSPKAQPSCFVQDFTLIQRKWDDSGTPPPSSFKTWLISGSWNLYSLRKAFDWDCCAFRDLAPSNISFLLNMRGRYNFVLHRILWEYTYTTVHGHYRKTVAIMNEAHDLSFTMLSWKFHFNTLKLRSYIYTSLLIQLGILLQ